MDRKCMVCDGKGEKSIETKSDDYIKVGSSYVHTNCYLIKLTTRKKDRLKETDAIIEIERIKDIMKSESNLAQLKDDFYQLIMDYYDVNLSKYFYMKIAEVVNGTREGLQEPISFFELFEMYSNDKMMRKLDKIAHRNNITDGNGRIFWDLSVMIGEYKNYKKSKVSKLHEDDQVKKIIEESEKMKHVITKKETENIEDDSVSIMDLIID